MKIKGVILILAFGCGFSALAQGVLLGPGDTLSIGFDRVDFRQFTEFTFVGGSVSVNFGSNTLTASESLRLEMFENTVNESPVMAQTYSPTSPLTDVRLMSPGSWLDRQGVVRISVLAGSVDVTGTTFGVFPSFDRLCFTEVAVPEPSSLLLTVVGIVCIGLIWRSCRTRGFRT